MKVAPLPSVGIESMESRLDSITEATSALQEKLEELQKLKNETKSLYTYYGSEDWHSDREAFSAAADNDPGDLPKAGVLSEDLVYDSITELRDTAFTMLELGTEILKDWI